MSSFILKPATMNKPLIAFCFLTFCFLPIRSQTDFRVMHYNVENLFDCTDDPGKDDNEFLPDGTRRWTKGRYYHKLQQIAKVISAAGEWDTPALISLCEVENDSTVHHLLSRTPLRSQYYRYIITDSPDPRGIDVALLYQRDKFAYIGHDCHRIRFRYHKDKNSRDLLHVWGKVITGDTLDVFVCHFPSRSGGEKATEPDRKEAALLLKHITDSLFSIRTHPYILAMGDFNDTPDDPSIQKTLAAFPPSGTPDPHRLYNLPLKTTRRHVEGTHKYQGIWNRLDQFIVSGLLLESSAPFTLIPNSACIFSPGFLLTEDKTHRGVRPLRSYHGYKYEGGYSDHLPIIVDFTLSLP